METANRLAETYTFQKQQNVQINNIFIWQNKKFILREFIVKLGDET